MDNGDKATKQLAGALLRYRVLAMITGLFLLLLCVEMTVKYGFNGGEQWLGMWISQVHGIIYIFYLVTVIDLWTRARTGWGMLVAMVLAGVVPVLSFWQERRTTTVVQSMLAESREGQTAAG